MGPWSRVLYAPGVSRVIPDYAISALRTELETLMIPGCVVVRQESGTGTFDPETGVTTLTESTVYSGDYYIGDRVEGAFTSGGFGSNPQERAEDARTHNAVLRLPWGAAGSGDVQVGDFVRANNEQWRVHGREVATSRASKFYRIVKFDPEKSFS